MAERGWTGTYRVIDTVTGRVFDFGAAWLATRFVFSQKNRKNFAIFKNHRRYRPVGEIGEEAFAKSLQRWKPKALAQA